MKRRILAYLTKMLVAAVTVTAVLTALVAHSMFKQQLLEELSVDARLLSALLKEEGSLQGMQEVDDVLRVTLIDADGTVYYDNRAQASAMGGHLDRPEVKRALETGEGYDVRESETAQSSTYYYAMLQEDGGVLRVAKESSSIWSVYMRALPLIALLVALMIGAGALVARAMTDRLVEPLRRLADDMDGKHSAASYPELQPFMRRIRRQHEEIMRSANMRVEFTANVSHELKTPLTSISGYAELIESGMAEGDMARVFAGKIHKSANRLLTLINDIIRLSQMDSPEHEIDREPVEPGLIAEVVVEQLRLNAQKMNVTMRVETRPCMVEADRQMMEELIYNLCDNAIRYNVHGGSVLVSVLPVRERVMLTVQDTGIGISQENQERVFERFYRVDKSRSKATGGTGLGLAIVKHIAAKHDAAISLESKPGVGTTITVSFARMERA